MVDFSWVFTNFFLILIVFARPVNAFDAGNAMYPVYWRLLIELLVVKNSPCILFLVFIFLLSFTFRHLYIMLVALLWRSCHWLWWASARASGTSRAAAATPLSLTPDAHFTSRFSLHSSGCSQSLNSYSSRRHIPVWVRRLAFLSC